VSIRKISLHNFRGFRGAEIELKPLTVLLGPNSAGKSSFGHALAAMTHAHRVYAGTPQATLTPIAGSTAAWPVDLGNLDDLRTNGATGPVKVGIETAAGFIETGFGLDSSASLLPSYFLYPKGEESAGKRVGDVGFVTPVSSVESSARTGTIGPKVIYESTHFEVRRLNELQWQESGIPSVVILDGLLLKSITHERGTPRLLSGKARDELGFLLQNLTYLRAARRRPSRTYQASLSGQAERERPLRNSESPQEIGYAGERCAALLHQRGEESVDYAELPRIPNTLEEAKQQRGQAAKLASGTLLASTAMWLKRLRLANELRTESSNKAPGRIEVLLRLPNQREHNMVEIGFGTSQVLPILVAGLLQAPGSLLIVDLPEAHLHPRPQSDLADFFCSLALSGRFSLIETHSEMFFHRLRLRAEMDDVLKDNIAVYFIDEPKNGSCCEPRRVGLDLDEQPHWPVGFLQEAWETEAQIEAVRQSKALAIRK
jgi:AAA ATPase domain/AAA domain, putative AbiEii toxin, Type IV TA system